MHNCIVRKFIFVPELYGYFCLPSSIQLVCAVYCSFIMCRVSLFFNSSSVQAVTANSNVGLERKAKQISILI